MKKFVVQVTRNSDFSKEFEAKDKYDAEEKMQEYIDNCTIDPFGDSKEEYVFNTDEK